MYRGELPLGLAMDYAFHLPPGSATWRAVGGPSAWTDEVHTLMALLDTARVANWQRTEDGAKNRNAPPPLPRPTLQVESKQVDTGEVALTRAQIFLARQEERRRAAAGVAEEG